MTSFCTAKRHEEEKSFAQLPQKALKSGQPHDLASTSLSRGMDKLLNLQSAASIRRTASLPPLPGSNPVSPFLSATQMPLGLSGPATQPEPRGLCDHDKPEEEKLKDDRKVAEQEFGLYLSAGLVKVSEGTNLIRFWDVSRLLLSSILGCSNSAILGQ
jgi:hypothetical protein